MQGEVTGYRSGWRRTHWQRRIVAKTSRNTEHTIGAYEIPGEHKHLQRNCVSVCKLLNGLTPCGTLSAAAAVELPLRCAFPSRSAANMTWQATSPGEETETCD
jgi:hypothetical protein